MRDVQKTVLIPYEKYLRFLEKIPTEVQEGKGVSTELLLSAIPKPYVHKVNAILSHMTHDPKHVLGWNERGELEYRNRIIEGSHILDLLKDTQREYGRGPPKGHTEFYEGLKDINIPRSLIGNEKRRLVFLDNTIGLPPGIPDHKRRRITPEVPKEAKNNWIRL